MLRVQLGGKGGLALAFIAVNARGDRPCPAVPPGPLLASLPPGAPVTVLIHGYRHSPDDPANDPHAEVLSPLPGQRGRRRSWPLRLGLVRGPGLGIGLGWQADGSLAAAHARAAQAGVALARLIRGLRARHAAPVGLFAHSLGARVALAALPHLRAGDVGRIVLLAGAERQARALAALDSPAGRAAQVLNVTSARNDAFDLAFHWLAPDRAGGPALGAGLPAPQAVTLRLDDPAHRAGLAALGFRIAAPGWRPCHWSGYMHPGLFPLYRAILTRPDPLPLAALRAALPQQSAAGRSHPRVRPLPPPGFAVQ